VSTRKQQQVAGVVRGTVLVVLLLELPHAGQHLVVCVVQVLAHGPRYANVKQNGRRIRAVEVPYRIWITKERKERNDPDHKKNRRNPSGMT